MSSKIVVVGGGFVGSSVAKWLSSRFSVKVVDRVNRLPILDVAMTVKRAVTKVSKGKIRTEVKIVRTKQKSVFSSRDKQLIRVNLSKVRAFLGLQKLTSPSEAIEEIVKLRLSQ